MRAVAGLWIVGAGGLGREALDAAAAAGVTVAGVADDAATARVPGYDVIAVDALPRGVSVVIAIGSGQVRGRLAERLAERGCDPVVLAHPQSTVASRTVLGPGCLLLAGCFVSVDTVLGAHVQVHYGATVGHDAQLGDCTTVLPGANVSGTVRLDEGVTLGAGSVVLPGLAVGAGAFVGAGAVVTRDVAPGTVVVGMPARPVRR